MTIKQRGIPKELKKKLIFSTILFWLFLIFSAIALFNPKWGIGYSTSEYSRGLDVVFAIDVSRSMDIRDAQVKTGFSSRLNSGLLIAGESAQAVSGARLAAAIGRGTGYLAVPLAFDNETFFTFIETLDGSSMTGRSTNLEALTEAAANAFIHSSINRAARKVIVLISDGESHSGNLRNAVNRCVNDNIIINAVAVGSDEGRPAPSGMDDNESSAVVNAAISRRDAAVMRMAAERTGGIYIDGNREDAASVLSTHLLSLVQESGTGNRKQEPKQRYALFIILAIISYGVSKFLPLLPVRRHSPLISIIAVLFVFTSCSEGKLLLIEANYLNSRGRYDEAVVPYLKALDYEDSAPYAEYGLGLTFQSLEERTAALKRYGSSQTMLENLPGKEHRELRYRNHYNSGIIFFEEEDFDSAAAAFREALREDPGKIDVKRNLELSLLFISRKTDREEQTENRQETREILFGYIRQQEQQRWRSREWTPEENHTGPDW